MIGPQTRKSPAVTELVRKPIALSCVDSTTGIAPFKDVSSLLRHHANFIEVVMQAICSGAEISIAGRVALGFTIDRIRQVAEVLRGR